jgi:hypothetical protein
VQGHSQLAGVKTGLSAALSLLLPLSLLLLLLLLSRLSFLQDEEGVPEDRLFPISAVTGRGVREAVTAVRGVLDELGPAEVVPETDALNITTVPRRFAPEVREREEKRVLPERRDSFVCDGLFCLA